jgi:transcription elongation factor Elf1
MKIKKGEHFTCPECGETWESPIEDYVVSGKVGQESVTDEMCGGCDKSFTIEHLGDGIYDVEEA